MAEIDFKGMFDSFYDKLVLRDLVGKVVPGTIFLLSILLAAFGQSGLGNLLSKMTFALWIFTGAFGWLIGLALQYLGEILKILRDCPHRKKEKIIEGKDIKEKQNREEFYPFWASFQKNASKYEQLHAERLNVIKEACGNTAISLISGSAIVGFSLWWRGTLFSFPETFLLSLALCLSFCFWQMHIIHVERYGELVHRTVNTLVLNKTISGNNSRKSHNNGVQ